MAKDKLNMALDKLRMDYDITKAANFITSTGQEAITDLIVAGDDLLDASIGVQKNIKYKEKLIDLSVGTTILQTITAGNGVGDLTPSGGSVLADVDIEVVRLAVKEYYDSERLAPKIAGLLLKAGSDPSNPIPMSDIMLQLKGTEVSRLNSLNLWQGDTSTGGTTYTKFDGWMTIALNATGATSGGTAGAYTISNVLTSISAFELVATTKFPEWLTFGYFVYMSPSQFDIFYRTKFGTNGVIDSLTLNTGKPVTEFTIGAVTYKSKIGLTGVNSILATRAGNLVAGTDLVSETDFAKFEYLNEAEKFRLEIAYKLGAQIARPSEIVVTK